MVTVLSLVGRVALAALFTLSGLAKIFDRQGTRRAVAEFGVPRRMVELVAIALPVAELTCAALLIFSATAWWGALFALGLLAAFCMAIVVNLRRDNTPDCHCFGQVSSQPIGWSTLVRNALFAVPAIAEVAAGPSRSHPSLIAWFGELRPTERILTVVVAVLDVGMVALLFWIRRLSDTQRKLADSVRSVEALFDASTPPAPMRTAAVRESGLPIGVPAPLTRLSDHSGRETSLDELRGTSGHLVLIFASATCASCVELLASLSKRRDGRSLSPIAVVVAGTADENRRLVADFPDVPIVFSGKVDLTKPYRASWTPSGVAVDRDGRIATATYYGAAGVEALVDSRADDQVATNERTSWMIGSRIDAVDRVPLGSDSRPTALLLWRTSCPYCEALVEDLRALMSDPSPSTPTLVLVATNEEPVPTGIAPAVVVDSDGSIAAGFKLHGTPAAVLVDREGRISSQVCVGGDEVRLLLGPPS